MIAGLTGGIGSGKSTVARLLELLGCAVFRSDDSAREVYFDAAIKEKVIALLGQESYISDHKINKPYISAKVFGNNPLLQSLNNIIHPAVGQKFTAFARQQAGKIIVKESALLYEAGLEKQSDKIIVVAARDELRLQRVMQRDKLSHEEALRRLQSQMPQDEKIKRADFVIWNNDEELLIPQVLTIFNQLQPC